MDEDKIEQNKQFYLTKMEDKFKADQDKIVRLQERLHTAARKIQMAWKRSVRRKQFRAAWMIQKCWKMYAIRMKQRREVLERCKKAVATMKIKFFILRKLKKHTQSRKIKHNLSNMKQLRKASLLHKGIVANCPKYMVFASSLYSQLHYIRKYSVYDRRQFTEQWKAHETKQRAWIMEMVRKRWVSKGGGVWINEQQKEVNVQKYIQRTLQQSYEKHYAEFEASQARLKNSQKELREKIENVKRGYYHTLTALVP